MRRHPSSVTRQSSSVSASPNPASPRLRVPASPRLPLTSLLLASCLLLLLPALQPLLSSSLTCGYDNVFHLWRAVQVEQLWRQGVLFSRWAPDMAHGFGFPLFVFVSPLSASVAAALHLAGLAWPVALNATFALGIALGGLFAFLLGRELFGPLAGLVAAVAYVYAPYQAYEVFNRGSLWEAFAWAFPPLVMWGLHRWTVHRDRRAFAVGALALAALIFTHQLFAFLFAPLLVGWVLLAWYQARDPGPLLRGAAMGLLGLGLSAFYWLPGLMERGFVQTERLLGTWVFDYHNNFITLADLLAPPRSVDPALINDWPPKALGLVPVLIGLLSLARWRRMDRAQRAQVVLLLVLTAGFALMTFPVSLPLWEHLPLLPYVQFPWRFLGPAALCLALLAAAAFAFPRNTQYAIRIPYDVFRFGFSLTLAILILGNLGWFYPAHCPPPEEISIQGMIAWERATDTLGTTAKGEYLPIWVQRMPESDRLRAAYEAGGPIPRLDPESLPEGARVLQADYGPLGATLQLDALAPFRARYLALYYPGWRAWVDGEPVEVAPTAPEGLLAFDVPAGRHTLTIRFTETPLRLTADLISLASLLALLLLSMIQWPNGPIAQSPNHPVTQSPNHPATQSPSHLIPYLLLAIALVLLKMVVIDRVDNPLRHVRLRGGQLEGVDVPAQVTFDGQFRLLGYDALPRELPGDGPLELRLYWQDPVPGGPDYRVALALKDGRGLTWSDPDPQPPRWHRTPPPAYLWPPDGYALTAFDLQPMVGTPPGVYTVTLSVFDFATLVPFAAHDGAGQSLGLEIPLGQVELTRPRRPPEAAPAQYRADHPFGPIRLVGYNLDRAEAAPGDPFLLTLFWQAEGTPEEELRLQLSLQPATNNEQPATSNQQPATWNLPLSSFPTTHWQAGDLWRGQHLLRLPADLESGTYRWTLQVCRGNAPECEPMGAEAALGTLEVHAPQRLWEPPPLDVAVDARFGDVVTLLGANLHPASCLLHPASCVLHPGTPLTVTLVWQAEAKMETSHRVFLHLLGPDGSLVAQSDGEPANWTRPTTGWLPGEVVLDERVLAVPEGAPAGDYELWIGVYSWPSLERLPAFRPDGSRWPDDRILLAEIALSPSP